MEESTTTFQKVQIIRIAERAVLFRSFVKNPAEEGLDDRRFFLLFTRNAPAQLNA